MGRLVDDMLTLAKFDQRRPMSQEAVNLSQMLRDIHLDASATAPERVLTVSFDGLDHDLIVTGDDDRLRQAISNVVANALLHTPAGGPVELSLTSSEGDLAIVTITDHGLGMSQEDADRATERFWRADTSRSRAAGGSGLGLSIVDSVISAHGGTTTVTSQEGIGTTVRLVIPIGDTTSQDANAPATTG